MVTWNMQGGSTTERWQSAATLAKTYDVMALQEVPASPAAAQDRGPVHGTNIQRYLWNLGTKSRPINRHLFILPQPSKKLGIVTSWDPDEFREIGGVYRDAIAVGNSHENAMFASADAASGGGNDAASIVQRVQQAAGSRDFAVLGDFNRNPRDLRTDFLTRGLLALHIYNPGQPTQQSGGELDYMVSNVVTENWQATVQPNRGSDHWPVRFGNPRAAAASAQELELASELLEIEHEHQLEQLLDELASRVTTGQFLGSPTGRALGEILKDAAATALPAVGAGTATNVARSGDHDWGRTGAPGQLFEMELEGVPAEDKEFELARRYVQWATDAARWAAQLAGRAQAPPSAIAHQAATEAAHQYAPGLVDLIDPPGPRVGASAAGKGNSRSGRWIRHGRHIVVYLGSG